ncbi:TPA: hypothetical protein DDZ86_02470 [Candidatus Dependentiae bacterium]|nr:MAG: hypothetical protein UW09_C0001G0154 [candidate division TM6 bacterium GW2011_GWF2_43_87]HBL98483.1 hypothetical protein [Candidatus Dependentiae bacterium]
MKMSKYFLLSALLVPTALSFTAVDAVKSTTDGSYSQKKMKPGKVKKVHVSIKGMDKNELKSLNEKLNKLVEAQQKKEAMIEKAKARIATLKEKYRTSTPEQKMAMKVNMREKIEKAKERLAGFYKRLGVIENQKGWIEAYLAAKKQPAKKQPTTIKRGARLARPDVRMSRLDEME